MPTEHDTDRADRLLRKMHPVFSHDLPNQVVALQSLLQMLEMEEADRLGAEGRECVGRLKRVAGRVQGLARFLKDLGRLNSYQRRTESVVLAALVREVKVGLQAQCPEAAVECLRIERADAYDLHGTAVGYS